MSELENLRVVDEFAVGWCRATLPNETTDENGHPYVPGLAASDPHTSEHIEVRALRAIFQPDPRVPSVRAHDHPEVEVLRDRLREKNGLPGLEIVEPHEIERTARIFFRDGFVVVNNLLTREQLQSWREGCARVVGAILENKGEGGRKYETETARLPHRYSFGTGSASRSLLHDPVWAAMVDLPTTRPLLKELFRGEDYYVRGAGGDVCLPGAIEYQGLHADWLDNFKITPERRKQAERFGIAPHAVPSADELDQATAGQIIEYTPPHVTINFLMCDLTWENGPIREIPGSHGRTSQPPRLADEPEWMRLSTLVGAKAGAGVFRDNRAWHGGTPNLSREIRAMPNMEYTAPWMDPARYPKSMPHEMWETLSPHARHLCRHIKCDPGMVPAGAGAMRPAANKRKEARSGF